MSRTNTYYSFRFCQKLVAADHEIKVQNCTRCIKILSYVKHFFIFGNIYIILINVCNVSSEYKSVLKYLSRYEILV